MNQSTIEWLSESSIWPIAEFFTIAFIIIMTYQAIHLFFIQLKPATKMLVSMFMGTIAYTIAKIAIVALFFEPTSYPTTF